MEIYHEVAPLLEEFSRMGLGDSKELPQIDLYTVSYTHLPPMIRF